MIQLSNFIFLRAVLILLTLFIFGSCAMISGRSGPDFTKIHVGMVKEDVIKQIGRPGAIVSSKKYDDGILEVHEYYTWQPEVVIDSTTIYRQYWLFYFNNELQEWGTKKSYSPEDYDIYYRRFRGHH
ncbi:hypothetical protein HMPREF0765_3092 [Sphingobacterium spiritivorum ATCC 33300]|uniref:Lipoprotein SmpA/OmlA domain-containing protein n=2 Tax=Sphingobacterium spiritivorum TaxID=258 RepID=C2G0J2_SPHSI|nr:hypothetical protein HMPREF0765_3092 [Sphingobacterium spiritivorum ATCC 33300]QQS97470.1 hypothetical protein I6J03_07115 [Sphingobacterium spiritivorum]